MRDVVVVGSGLGGLTLGAILAKQGKSVTVLEQHYVPGGCAQIFHRKGVKFEVGLHAMDGMDADDPKMWIFRELGMMDAIPFVHLPKHEFYRFMHPELDIVLPGNVEVAIERLSERFPREKANIGEFFRVVQKIRKDLNGVFMLDRWKLYPTLAAFPFVHPLVFRHRNTTIGEFLDAMFEDEMLKLALIGNILYFDDDPRRLSLLWYALSQGSFFAGGVHFVKGGSQTLTKFFVKFIEERGGEVRVGRTVEEIIVERGTAVGVRHRKTLGSEGREEKLMARTVVANAPLPVVVNQLVDAPEIAKYRKKVNAMAHGCSFSSAYIAFDTSPKSLGNTAYSTVLPGEGVHRLDDMSGEYRSTDFTRKGFELVDYSQIDHGLAPDGKHVNVISLVDYISNWEQDTEEGYQAKKAEVIDILLDKLERMVPGTRRSVIHCELGTPRTIEKFTKNPGGCIYGFRQEPKQTAATRLRHTCPVDNLFFASAWVLPGGGFTGAMLSGMNCAKVVARALGSRAREAEPIVIGRPRGAVSK